MAFARDINTLTPIMTSNTTPSGYVASASTEYDADHVAWKAFNGTVSGLVDCWITASGTTTGWLAIQCQSAITATSYKITSRSYSDATTCSPKSWYFQGSNNGANWTTLDQRSNISTWTAAETKEFSVASPVAYAYHRLYVTANCGNASYMGLGELELIGASQIIPPSPICVPSALLSSISISGGGY